MIDARSPAPAAPYTLCYVPGTLTKRIKILYLRLYGETCWDFTSCTLQFIYSNQFNRKSNIIVLY